MCSGFAGKRRYIARKKRAGLSLVKKRLFCNKTIQVPWYGMGPCVYDVASQIRWRGDRGGVSPGGCASVTACMRASCAFWRSPHCIVQWGRALPRGRGARSPQQGLGALPCRNPTAQAGAVREDICRKRNFFDRQSAADLLVCGALLSESYRHIRTLIRHAVYAHLGIREARGVLNYRKSETRAAELL